MITHLYKDYFGNKISFIVFFMLFKSLQKCNSFCFICKKFVSYFNNFHVFILECLYFIINSLASKYVKSVCIY